MLLLWSHTVYYCYRFLNSEPTLNIGDLNKVCCTELLYKHTWHFWHTSFHCTQKCLPVLYFDAVIWWCSSFFLSFLFCTVTSSCTLSCCDLFNVHHSASENTISTSLYLCVWLGWKYTNLNLVLRHGRIKSQFQSVHTYWPLYIYVDLVSFHDT